MELLAEGVALLREMHAAMVDLEVIMQMELAGTPADSGFAEAKEAVEVKWKRFNELFGD